MLDLPVLLQICLCSPWSQPLPFHALALIPLFLAKVQLSPTLSISSLMIWYSELTALFLFLLARAAPAFLPTALSVALMPLFPFREAQFVQVFSAEACAILHALCWSRQHQQVCHFSSLLLLSDSCSVLASLSSHPSFLLSQTLWQIWQELSSLSSCSIRVQWVPGHSFFPRNNAVDELARRGALLVPYATPCSLSRIYSSFFSAWRRTVSSLNSLTHRFPQFPPRNLCSLVMLAVSTLIYAALDKAFF